MENLYPLVELLLKSINAHAQQYPLQASPTYTWTLSPTCMMAMEYSDDDSDEDLQFDACAVSRYAAPSVYEKLYSSHSLAMAAGAQNDDDDGWNSDDEMCLPDLPEQTGVE